MLIDKETNNFLQVGQRVECSACHPEKGYVDCGLVFKEHGIQCSCKCHLPDSKGWGEWEQELRGVFDLSGRDPEATLRAIAKVFSSTFTQQRVADSIINAEKEGDNIEKALSQEQGRVIKDLEGMKEGQACSSENCGHMYGKLDSNSVTHGKMIGKHKALSDAINKIKDVKK